MRRRAPLLLLLGLSGALVVAPAQAEPQPRFHAGAAAATLDLPGPAPAVPLQVRALYVSDGGTSNVVVSVPVRGWLAGYRDGARLGLTELRQEAAYGLATAFHPPVEPGLSGVLDGSGRLEGQAVTQANVVVASQQCAACPDLSGRTTPVDRAVLRRVYDATLEVVAAARRSARAATLERAVVDASGLSASVVALPGSDEAQAGDAQLPVLHVVDDTTRATLGTLLSVPVAPVDADTGDGHLGAAARALDARLGGVTVPVAATLRDQVPLVRGDRTGAERLGTLTAALVADAVRTSAQPVLDRDVAAAEVYQPVPAADVLSAGERSLLPPYRVGGAVGVWTTVLRFGEVAFVSQPGQAHPHVTRALRAGLTGAAVVGVVGTAQDDLGEVGAADRPTLARQTVQAALLAAGQAGYATSAPVDAQAPAAARYAAAGVQLLVLPRAPGEGGAGVPVSVVWSDARVPAERATALPRLRVDGVETAVTGAAGRGEAVLQGAGVHRLRAELPGTSAVWETCVRVVDPSTVLACTS